MVTLAPASPATDEPARSAPATRALPADPDPLTFDAFYTQAWPKFRAYAFSRLHDESQAEDLASAVLARLWERWDAYQDRGLGRWPWAWRALHNACVSADRRRRSLAFVSLDAIPAAAAIFADPRAACVGATEDRLDLAAALSRLSRSNRKTLALLAAGAPGAAAARFLEIGEGAWRARVWRARQALAAALADPAL